MEHTFLIDNYVLVLERKKITFKKKTQKISYQPNKYVKLIADFQIFISMQSANADALNDDLPIIDLRHIC